MEKEQINILLKKYLNGEITPEEVQKLREVSNLSSDNDLQEIFSGLWEEYESENDRNVLQSVQRTPKPETDGRMQPFKDGKRSVWLFRRWMQVAAVLLLLLTTGMSLYLMKKGNEQANLLADREIVAQVGKGQCADVTLPDGTVVRLNSESSIRYRQDFGITSRDVKFTGEGFFKVAKDKEKKFTIDTRFMDIEVLGTSFNLYAYEAKDFVEVTLVKGKVSLRTNTIPIQTATLKPHSKAVYDKISGKLSIENTSTVLETVWFSDEMVFHSEPLENVFRKIERRYGVVMKVGDNRLLSDVYTGVFDKETLKEVMEFLSIHFNFRYQIEEDTVFIH